MVPTHAFAGPRLDFGQVAVVMGTDGDGLNLRDAPSLAANIITVMLEGAQVELLAPDVEDEDGLIWSHVAYEGVVGYSVADFLGNQSDTDPQLEPGQVMVVMQTGGDGLNMRDAPSLAAAVLTTMPEGAQVEVLLVDAEGDSQLAWSQIVYDGTLGYAAADFLGNASETIVTPVDDPLGHLAIGTIARVTGTDGDGLNLRAAASRTALILTTLGEGGHVRILDGPSIDALGDPWYAVDVDDRVGWLHGDFLISAAAAAWCVPGISVLGMSDALDKVEFDGFDVGGLSALVETPQPAQYVSLVDRQDGTPARVFTLTMKVAVDGFDELQVVGVTVLRDAAGNPFTSDTFDGEGLAVLNDGSMLVASETEPSIRRFSYDGQLIEELSIPDRFRVEPHGGARANESFEGLSLGPDEDQLLVAVESPLQSDGWTDDGRGRIRMLNFRRAADGMLQPGQEFFYLTEPGGHVTDILVLSGQQVLVLERSSTPEHGLTVRLFRVHLDLSQDVSGSDSLAADAATPRAKTLLVDLADCSSAVESVVPDGSTPLVDNFEGLALGPRLEDGRQVLLLQSDDNFESSQRTRLLALAIADLDGQE